MSDQPDVANGACPNCGCDPASLETLGRHGGAACINPACPAGCQEDLPAVLIAETAVGPRESEPLQLEDMYADISDEWADYCIPHCPDDVCRNSGHCAWPVGGRRDQ